MIFQGFAGGKISSRSPWRLSRSGGSAPEQIGTHKYGMVVNYLVNQEDEL